MDEMNIEPELMQKTLVILPAFNEVDALPKVLNELWSLFPQQKVLVVDDGSTDQLSLIHI